MVGGLEKSYSILFDLGVVLISFSILITRQALLGFMSSAKIKTKNIVFALQAFHREVRIHAGFFFIVTQSRKSLFILRISRNHANMIDISDHFTQSRRKESDFINNAT